MSGWNRLSLRVRLSLLYAGLLVSSVGIVGGYSYWNVWRLLIGETARHLRARAKPVIEHGLEQISGEEDPAAGLSLIAERLARDLTSRNTTALVLDVRGRILASGRRLPEELEPPPPVEAYYARALSGENEVDYRTEVGGTPVWVMLIPLRLHPGDEEILGVVQLGTALTDIERFLFRHGIMLVGVMCLVLVLGTALGFLFTSSTLRKLRELSSICRHIADGDYGKRVDLPFPKDEIGGLAAAFNRMIDRIESTIAAQKRFVANAAHELRTPLTGLQGGLEVLLRGAQDDPEAVARLSRRMYGEVGRLIRLCERLLGLVRLESTPSLQRRRVHLSCFFEAFMPRARLLGRGRILELREGAPVRVSVDPDMLNQILLDLLSNAFQHTPEGSVVSVGWKALSGEVEIQVEDRGEGIDPEDLPHVFEPFYQGSSPIRKAGSSQDRGAGLGLSLVRTMVEMHSGTLSIESRPGRGTKVSFTLPLE